MTAVGQKPAATTALQLRQTAQQAEAMIAKGKALKDNKDTAGQGADLVKQGRAMRDRALEQAINMAEAGAGRGAKLREGFVAIASDEQRELATVAAEIASHRGVDDLDEWKDHEAVWTILGKTPAREVKDAVRDDLKLAASAIDSARFDADGNPVMAPTRHMSALEITMQQMQFAEALSDFGPMYIENGALTSEMLKDIEQAHAAVQIVRAQRAALENAPPGLTQRLAAIDDESHALDILHAGCAGVIAAGMVAAMARPEEMAALQIDAGFRAALMNIAANTRAAFGAADAASFEAKVGPAWGGVVWSFLEGQLAQLDESDPVVKQIAAQQRQNLSAFAGPPPGAEPAAGEQDADTHAAEPHDAAAAALTPTAAPVAPAPGAHDGGEPAAELRDSGHPAPVSEPHHAGSPAPVSELRDGHPPTVAETLAGDKPVKTKAETRNA